MFVVAHQTGFSAILTQGSCIENTKAVAVAWRTTTETEKQYSQLDLETTAVDFGLRKFLHLLVGQRCQCQRCHCPAAACLTLELQKEAVITYRTNTTAAPRCQPPTILAERQSKPSDYLSRHATPIESLPAQIAADAKEHQMLIFLLHQPITSTIFKDRIQKALANDRQLGLLSNFLAIGKAPRNDPTLKPFAQIFSELSIGADEIIYKGEQFVLPTSLHDEIITHAHASSHAGQSAMKRRIRAHLWFPGLENAVRMRIESCHRCQVRRTNPIKVPFSSAPVPKQLWDSVSLDLFGPLPHHSHILVFRCNLSRFPDAKIVKSTRAEHSLPALASIHNNFGNPKEHKADNGPPI